VTAAIHVIVIDISVAVLPQRVYPVSTSSLWSDVSQRQSWSNNMCFCKYVWWTFIA